MSGSIGKDSRRCSSALLNRVVPLMSLRLGSNVAGEPLTRCVIEGRFSSVQTLTLRDALALLAGLSFRVGQVGFVFFQRQAY